MENITGLLTAPVQPWDALICTSTAVQGNVQRLLTAQQEYLRQHLGAQRFVLPRLPIIPLGIHTSDFAFTPDQRQSARQQLGIGTDTLVVLFAGRLSFHAKAHPLAMYQALEQAVKQTGQSVLLIECGWYANDFIQQAFADGAQQYAPSIRTITLDGRQANSRQTAWASADLFCSLSDNLQETFGLVPIEAMAAGLPVVVSDWDGYRDTVQDGIDGFCVPTLMPEPGRAEDLAQRHALGSDTYDMYCGHTCSLIAVDIEATTRAFVELFQSAELRQRMGEAGRQRAREVYDWSVIIPRYEALWAELAELRQQEGPELPTLKHPWPARLEPFHAYASYPTRTLSAETRLELVDADPNTAWQRVQRFQQLAMVNFAHYVIPQEEELRQVLNGLANGSQTANTLVAEIEPTRQNQVLRGLVWLVKLGVLRVVP
jgi:glycosyltransferase involved in cell wall biosynthesis